MRFKDVSDKYFNFRNYLETKYDGLFDNTVPSKKQIYELKNKIKWSRDQGDKVRMGVELNKLTSKFNKVWQEWRRQQ